MGIVKSQQLAILRFLQGYSERAKKKIDTKKLQTYSKCKEMLSGSMLPHNRIINNDVISLYVLT